MESMVLVPESKNYLSLSTRITHFLIAHGYLMLSTTHMQYSDITAAPSYYAQVVYARHCKSHVTAVVYCQETHHD